MYIVKQKNDWLMHYGVKGQSWGVRRFQNEDGTLTAAGKERYQNMMPSSARNQKKMADRKNPNRKSSNDDYGRLLFNRGYDTPVNASGSYLVENAISDEQDEFEEWCKNKTREEMVDEMDKKYIADCNDYGKDIADKLKKARYDTIMKIDSAKQHDKQVRDNAAKENYLQKHMPASAWNQRMRERGR